MFRMRVVIGRAQDQRSLEGTLVAIIPQNWKPIAYHSPLIRSASIALLLSLAVCDYG